MTTKATDDPRMGVDPVVSAILDQRIAAMRRLLAAMEPASTASALRVLRQAFPDVPLDARVRALGEARH
jgi:hypothetical protein